MKIVRREFLYASALVVLGVVIIMTPWYILPVCEVLGHFTKTAMGTEIPMKCGWTARAEFGTGAGIIAIGVALLLFGKRQETQRAMGIVGCALGAFTALFPTYIIGVCATTAMLCNPGTRPALVLLGV